MVGSAAVPEHGLQVVGRVPAGVEQHYPIGRHEIDAHVARFCGQQKHPGLVVVVETLDHLLPIMGNTTTGNKSEWMNK